MPRLHDQANIEQTSSKCIQNSRAIAQRLLDVCCYMLAGRSSSMFGRSCKRGIGWEVGNHAQHCALMLASFVATLLSLMYNKHTLDQQRYSLISQPFVNLTTTTNNTNTNDRSSADGAPASADVDDDVMAVDEVEGQDQGQVQGQSEREEASATNEKTALRSRDVCQHQQSTLTRRCIDDGRFALCSIQYIQGGHKV